MTTFSLKRHVLIAITTIMSWPAFARVSQLKIATAPQTVELFKCSAEVKVQALDRRGRVASVFTDKNVSLRRASTDLKIFADRACTKPLSSLVIRAGTSTTAFHFTGQATGQKLLAVSSPYLMGDSQYESIVSSSISSAPTPTPAPGGAGALPTTAAEWGIEYDGYGFVNFDATSGSVVFAPQQSTSSGETHASLLIAKRFISQPLKNFRMTLVATTEQQLRLPTPNAWECFWIFFNYVYDSNGKKITNYFTMKPNGIELGRAYDELGQNFLSTATHPVLKIGLPNTYVIEKSGGTLRISIDGQLVVNYDSSTGPYPLYDFAGTIGLYTEDARVRVHAVNVEPL